MITISQYLYLYAVFCERFVAYDALFSEGTHRCTDSQHVTVTSDHQKILKFIGKMLAVALCHRNVVDFRLAQPVLKMVGTLLPKKRVIN